MNKGKMVQVLMDEMKMKEKDAKKAVELMFDNIITALKNGEKASFAGFGIFEVRERKARKGRNPQTGEEIEIPASKIPAFKPAKPVKEIFKVAN